MYVYVRVSYPEIIGHVHYISYIAQRCLYTKKIPLQVIVAERYMNQNGLCCMLYIWNNEY